MESISPGQIIDGRYQLVNELGEGGMGVVFRAQHTEMDRAVAIKFLKPSLLTDKDKLDRFMREAQTVSRLKHQNIVNVYAVGQTPTGAPYIAMEYVEGERLSDLIQQRGFLQTEEALPLFIQVCEALAHAHQNKIVHRDIKPSNIMIVQEPDGQRIVKVLDFGIAKSIAAGEQGLTQTGHVMGSAFYMSPGQCEGRVTDLRSDVYSLGCTLFEALTGKPPFQGETFYETLNKQLTETPKAINEANPRAQITNELQAVIDCMLHKDRDMRYQSMDKLRADLEKVLKGEKATEIPLNTGNPAHRRKFKLSKQQIAGITIGVAIVIIGLVAFNFLQQSKAPIVANQPSRNYFKKGVIAEENKDYALAEQLFSAAIEAAERDHADYDLANYEHRLGWMNAKIWLEQSKHNPRPDRNLLDNAKRHVMRAQTIADQLVATRLHDPKSISDSYFRKQLLPLYFIAFWDGSRIATIERDRIFDQYCMEQYMNVFDVVPNDVLNEMIDERAIKLSKGMMGYMLEQGDGPKLIRFAKSYLRAMQHRGADKEFVISQGEEMLGDIKMRMSPQDVECFRQVFRDYGYAL